MPTRRSGVHALLFAAALLAGLGAACSSDSSGDGGFSSSGGSAPATGGSSSSGGSSSGAASSRGGGGGSMATGGVSATTGGTPSTGGASGGNTAGGGNPSTGGQSQAGDPGTGGSESGGEPGDGGEAGEPSLGGSSGAGGEPSATGGTGATGGGPDDCPSGQMWCPGCTPGTGSCGVACVGAVCPECAQAETLEACDALPNCHPVFRDDRVCGCATVGCCTHFDRCEPGDQALCQAPQTFGCTIDEPYCEGDYVISYTNICYEGCARVKDCSEAP